MVPIVLREVEIVKTASSKCFVKGIEKLDWRMLTLPLSLMGE